MEAPREEESAPREHVGGVFGIAVALLLFAGTALWIAGQQGEEIDGSALLAAHFEPFEPPASFELQDAVRLPGGESFLRFSVPGAPVPEVDGVIEALPETDEDDPESEDEKGDDWVDWTRVEIGEEGAAPSDVCLIFHPAEKAESLMERYFRNFPRRGVDGLEGDGGNVVIESGDTPWGIYETTFVRQRRFKKFDGEPNFVDSIRVNLTRRGAPCVLILIWPRGLPGSVEHAEAWLERLAPLTRD